MYCFKSSILYDAVGGIDKPVPNAITNTLFPLISTTSIFTELPSVPISSKLGCLNITISPLLNSVCIMFMFRCIDQLLFPYCYMKFSANGQIENTIYHIS